MNIPTEPTPTPKGPITELVPADPRDRQPWSAWLVVALVLIGLLVAFR